jgi:phage baseplate assembly protein gpV
MELSDGTTLPSYLEVQSTEGVGAEESLSETTLRVGEVVAAFAPEDSNNRGPTAGVQWVYVVNVSYRNGSGMRSVVPYRCTVADLFGGLGDHLRHRVRRTDRENPNGTFANGAQVLVLCPNGDKSNALIIGGVRHTKDKTPDTDNYLDFALNGVLATIGADGSFSITVPGPSKLDGSPDERDENNHGSKVTFAKSGDITISDENGDSVAISPKDKSITVKAGDHATEVEKKWTLKAATVEVEADEVTVKADKVNLGGSALEINPLDEVVVGSGVDTFTGAPYKALGNTSLVVKAKKQ